MRTRTVFLSVLAVLVLVLTSCGATPAPTATTAPTAPPAASAAPATAVPTKAPTAAPTAAPTKPPAPTATAAPALPKVVRINMGAYPDSLDPQKQIYAVEISISQFVYQLLTRLDPKTNQVIPDAAEKWEASPDGKSMTFHLRAGLKRADGTAITAKDFVWVYKRLADPRTGAAMGSIYTDVVGVAEALAVDPTAPADVIQKALDATGYKAVDDRTFQVTFKQPALFWDYLSQMYPAYLADPRFVDKDPEGWYTAVANHNGSGPYRITKIVESNSIILAANPNYWAGKPKIERIELYFVTDTALALAAYRKGEIDIIQPAAEDMAIIQADPVLSKEFVRQPQAAVWFLILRGDRAPFDNPMVRKAFSQAFDRVTWSRDVLKGQGQPWVKAFPPGIPGTADAEQAPFDPKAAVQTLIDAGFGAADSTKDKPKIDCKKLGELKLTYSATPRNHARYQYLAYMFISAFGCAVTLDPVDATTLTALSKDKTTAPVFRWTGVIGDYPHPSNWLSFYGCTGLFASMSGWCNQEYEKAYAAGNAATDPAKAAEQYKLAQQVVVNDYGFVFTNYTEAWFLVKPYLLGFKENPCSVDVVFPGAYGSTWTYDVDLTKVGAGYPTK